MAQRNLHDQLKSQFEEEQEGPDYRVEAMKASGGFNGGYFPAPHGQDQPVNISIEHRTLNF